jgi:hypothetical protein
MAYGLWSSTFENPVRAHNGNNRESMDDYLHIDHGCVRVCAYMLLIYMELMKLVRT